MKIEQKIQDKLTQDFSPDYLDVLNESHLHSGPATESHFRVLLVSDIFEGKPLIARHRTVQESLKSVIGDIHALGIQALTLTEFETKKASLIKSPACKGANK